MPLISVMIGRAEQRSAQPAACDIGEIPFDRLGLGDVDLIKVGLGKTKRVPLEKLPIDRERAVLAKLKQRNVRRRGQLHIVTGRSFQKQSGQGKKRMRERN